ncbi:MAG: class I adenylate-forming enzyme family protein [Bauldia sp.]
MNLYSRLAYLARYQAAKTAVEHSDRHLTYHDLDQLARRIAGRLRLSGVGQGDVVGVLLRETPEHVAALFVIMRLGAIVLPLDWRGTRAEFDRITTLFRPKVILNDDSPLLDWSPAMVGLAEMHDAEADTETAEVTDRPMGFSLTSGSTGAPKAMIVTHEQLYARCAARAIEGVFERGDRFLATLPLAYAAGREHAICLILLGATLVLFPPLFEPQGLVTFVNDGDITAVSLSPNMSRALLAMKEQGEPLLMPNLRTIVSTTGKLLPEERAQLRARVAPRVIDYYGSTGTGPIAISTGDEPDSEPTAAGRCVVGIEIEIADDAGRPVPQGEIGRIRVRGPAITTDVVGGEGSEEEGFRDGWYYTGDLASIGPGGILHLHGRSADLIKRGGLMIHAQEVEGVLRRLPSVVDAAVVGAPCAELGQKVVAFVVTRSPVEAKEIIRRCRRELAPFKVPCRVHMLDSLPRNPNGKLLKSELLKHL